MTQTKELVELDWSSLFKMQNKLDRYIETNHNLANKDLFSEKCLALLVELGELANETRCFKFWSKKPSSARTTILEEYVDGVHFIMSLGIDQGFKFESQPLLKSGDPLTEIFLNVFEACILLKQQPSQQNYEHLFLNYLQLGIEMDITEMEIKEAYKSKNKVNYNRQDEGY